MIKVSDLKKDFPIFDREINGKRLTYLDSGATSQKPNSVISEMTNVYTNMNANVHRGTYVLSSETTAKYEDCLLYTSPSPRDVRSSRMPSSA